MPAFGGDGRIKIGRLVESPVAMMPAVGKFTILPAGAADPFGRGHFHEWDGVRAYSEDWIDVVIFHTAQASREIERMPDAGWMALAERRRKGFHDDGSSCWAAIGSPDNGIMVVVRVGRDGSAEGIGIDRVAASPCKTSPTGPWRRRSFASVRVWGNCAFFSTGTGKVARPAGELVTLLRTRRGILKAFASANASLPDPLLSHGLFIGGQDTVPRVRVDRKRVDAFHERMRLAAMASNADFTPHVQAVRAALGASKGANTTLAGTISSTHVGDLEGLMESIDLNVNAGPGFPDLVARLVGGLYPLGSSWRVRKNEFAALKSEHVEVPHACSMIGDIEAAIDASAHQRLAAKSAVIGILLRQGMEKRMADALLASAIRE